MAGREREKPKPYPGGGFSVPKKYFRFSRKPPTFKLSYKHYVPVRHVLPVVVPPSSPPPPPSPLFSICFIRSILFLRCFIVITRTDYISFLFSLCKIFGFFFFFGLAFGWPVPFHSVLFGYSFSFSNLNCKHCSQKKNEINFISNANQ